MKIMTTQNTYFVYILECNDKTYYCGYTNNIEKRLKDHNNKASQTKYTRTRQPVKIVYCEQIQTKTLALKREYQIKQLSHLQKHRLINNIPSNLVK